MDLQFVRDIARPYYRKEGQKSIDPAVFFRLMLIGYLENIISDRQLIGQVPGEGSTQRTLYLILNSLSSESFPGILQGRCPVLIIECE